jgi:hypothetical protein
MRSTIFDNSEKENTAAAVILNTPAMVVASRMDNSVVSILSLGGNMQQSCKLKHGAPFSAIALSDAPQMPTKKIPEGAGIFA